MLSITIVESFLYPVDTLGLPETRRHAWAAYLRTSQDVVYLCQTQRFKDADGPPVQRWDCF